MSKTCPSSRCEEGALLLGTVREDGTIAFAAEPRVVSRTESPTRAKVSMVRCERH